ncbi:hypothetical protein ACFFOM_19065 [Microlunatus capsulatus]|uniref:Uncharacterized protein n=1 Tax=Microlunatus capsulatus TaxID=99117 RepID=A0ABS4ZF82_9ACTN|nr:hypothetical protein [Microlunatus capsulatus]MBP2418888.1 hypothetical protein [Microlunatus capsulatus]
MSAESSAPSPAWIGIARWAGTVAGLAFLGQSVLYLLDSMDILSAEVAYQQTNRGFQQDLADYYVALGERMHHLWWDVAIRDVLGPLGWLALMVLVLAVHGVTPSGRPLADLAVLFTVVGGSLAGLSDLLYLSRVSLWRRGALQPTPDLVASGRAGELVEEVSTYLQWGGFFVLAAAFVCLALTIRSSPGRPRFLSVVMLAEAAALLAFVLTAAADAWSLNDLTAVLAGMVLAPLVCIGTGWQLHRLAG